MKKYVALFLIAVTLLTLAALWQQGCAGRNMVC